MPNWCLNTIICKEDLLSKIVNSEKSVDFTILIPEPETISECSYKYGEKYLDEKDIEGFSVKHLDHSDGRDWFNWYDWHCDFWGTKWNACDTRIYKDDGYVYVEFSTAWSRPDKWIQKLSGVGKPFIIISEYEDGGGDTSSYNGKFEFTRNEDDGFPDVEILQEFFGD